MILLGAAIQRGHGLLSSIFSKVMPFLGRAAKTTVQAAKRFGKSKIGNELKDTLISAAADSAVGKLKVTQSLYNKSLFQD